MSENAPKETDSSFVWTSGIVKEETVKLYYLGKPMKDKLFELPSVERLEWLQETVELLLKRVIELEQPGRIAKVKTLLRGNQKGHTELWLQHRVKGLQFQELREFVSMDLLEVVNDAKGIQRLYRLKELKP